MLQKAMSVRPGETPDAQFINKLLSTNFDVMQGLGESTLKPFLQVCSHCPPPRPPCAPSPPPGMHDDRGEMFIQYMSKCTVLIHALARLLLLWLDVTLW